MLFVVLTILGSIANTQVPSQDACQLVNATEPPQCPDTIGPPCPPCIINESPNYVNGDSLVLNGNDISNIKYYIDTYVNYWLDNYPPSKVTKPEQDPTSIVEGFAGRALMFLRLYNNTNNASYLTLANEYIASALARMDRAPKTPSYFVGLTGVYVVAAQIEEIQGKPYQTYLDEVNKIYDDAITAINNGDSTSPTYGFDMFDGNVMTGLSGLLYSGMLVNKYFGGNIVPTQQITILAHYIIEMGLQTAAPYNDDYLIYEFAYEKGCYVLGSAEGSGGAIKMLLEAYYQGYVPDLMTNATYKSAITNTLNWFVNSQFSDGNIPTYSTEFDICANVYGNDSDARVQWCHGAPGFISTFTLAGIVYDSIGETSLAMNYINAGLKAFNSTWERGLLIKGTMMCHGIGGNTFTLLHINEYMKILLAKGSNQIKNTYNLQYLINQSQYRAINFVRFTLNATNLNALRTKYSNEDYSAWLGSYGIPFLYSQTLLQGWPGSVSTCMPAWDFCGL